MYVYVYIYRFIEPDDSISMINGLVCKIVELRRKWIDVRP